MLLRELDGELKLEGDLIIKRISLDTAWVIDVLDDLLELPDEIVVGVEENLDANHADIIYNKNLRSVTFDKLYELIAADRIFGSWRLLTTALQLTRHLQELHHYGIAQLLIHPQRICFLGDNIRLIPSLAGVLSPFPSIVDENLVGWLFYVAPEVIRTRGLNLELLFKGDVYALGQTLFSIITNQNYIIGTGDPYVLLTDLVENPQKPDGRQASGVPAAFLEILIRMCSPVFSERPHLDEVADKLQQIVNEMGDVESRLEALIEARDISAARDMLAEIEPRLGTPLAGISEADHYYYQAQLEILTAVNDHEDIGHISETIRLLRKAETIESTNIRVKVSLGDTYRLYSTHPNHLHMAVQAYEQALKLSGWDRSILVKWLGVFRRWKAVLFLQETLKLKSVLRPIPIEIFYERVQAFLDLKQPERAWDETVMGFQVCGYDETLYEKAKEIAGQFFTGPLMIALRTKYENETGNDWPDASLSVMWASNGNLDYAELHLKRAEASRPSI